MVVESAGDLGKVAEDTGELGEGGVEVSGWRSAPKTMMKDVGGNKQNTEQHQISPIKSFLD